MTTRKKPRKPILAETQRDEMIALLNAILVELREQRPPQVWVQPQVPFNPPPMPWQNPIICQSSAGTKTEC